MLSDEEIQHFDRQGYLVVRGLLDPAQHLSPTQRSLGRLVDDLARIFLTEGNDQALRHYEKLDFPNRFATLIGAAPKPVLDHLDPALNVQKRSYQYREHLPSAQTPELFSLIRCAPILDVVEDLIGPEIDATPLNHFNLRFGQSQEDLIQGHHKHESGVDKKHFSIEGFNLGRYPWHTDSQTVLADATHNQIINVWIPMTEARIDNGCLLVIPRSHKLELAGGRVPQAMEKDSVALTTQPGDVILMHLHLAHSSMPNTTEEDYRLAFNFRYVPRGTANGRPYLPGFTARSRSAPESELHDPELWAAMWNRALGNSSNERPLPTPATLDSVAAAQFTKKWRERVPTDRAWLDLPPPRPRRLRKLVNVLPFLRSLRVAIGRQLGSHSKLPNRSKPGFQ